ncbi:MAG TPA: allantoinase AllB [Gemmatimonadota bacterium]|nr:allantoinase AllB [Gemmatimonadota bacterium]
MLTLVNPSDFILASRRVVLHDRLVSAAIRVREGIIASIGSPDDLPPEDRLSENRIIDVGESVVMPGLVDTHVHVNEPGRTEWEGFDCATRAAAAGGVTTIVDMPLNSIPATTTVAALDAKTQAAEGRCRVDYGFWGGCVPGNAAELDPLVDAGVLGFKAFLVPSGVDEFPAVGEEDLDRSMPVLAARGLPLLVHAESPRAIRPPGATGAGRGYSDYLASRPPAAEEQAVADLIERSERFRAAVHVVHVSAAGTLPLVAGAKERGIPVTAETCPHYLTFLAEEIGDTETLLKCAPPIRQRTHREALWMGLREGALDMIVSDHSPCPPSLKRLEEGDFAAAWGGISSLGLGLAVVWTAGEERGVSLVDLGRWMSSAPARLAGLDDRKGSIELGKDADFVVWDPETTFEVDPERLHHRHRCTPYEGRRLRGVVRRTYLRGRLVYDDGAFPGFPAGRRLARRAA